MEINQSGGQVGGVVVGGRVGHPPWKFIGYNYRAVKKHMGCRIDSILASMSSVLRKILVTDQFWIRWPRWL